jgi:hypothetical protein
MPYNHSIKAASPSGTAYTGRADGLFSLNEQVRFKSSGLWAAAIAAPSAPTITSVTVSGTQVSVAFTAPSSLNGSTITGYTVTSSGGQTASGVSSPIVVTNLTAGTSYTFTVVANSTNGNSIASAASSSYLIPIPPTTIGQAYGGGFYAGKIAVGGGGVATHYLIVAPKASGEHSSRIWGTYGPETGITSAIDGPTNSASLAALGSSFQAAVFCEGITIGGYSDWYLPAKNELEVLYYFLKPSTYGNAITSSSGTHANAVSPEPISTNYTSGSPAQTSAVGFRTGETEAFAVYGGLYWCSTEYNWYAAWNLSFENGDFGGGGKNAPARMVRAVRRVAV